MPLVTCPDCGHQVSTAAATCPQCNRPLAPQLAEPAPGTLGAPAAEQIVWEGVPSLKAMIVEFAVTAFYAIALPIVAALAFDPLLSLVAASGRTGARAGRDQPPDDQDSRDPLGGGRGRMARGEAGGTGRRAPQPPLPGLQPAHPHRERRALQADRRGRHAHGRGHRVSSSDSWSGCSASGRSPSSPPTRR